MTDEPLPYRYYVTYTALNDDGQVRGEIDIERGWPITDFDELHRMTKVIYEKHPELHSVVITAWQRWEEPPE